MKIVIIDYGSGNLRSAAKAFEKVAGEKSVKVSAEAQDLNNATHIVLPGVGAFADCMAGLKKSKMIPELEIQVLKNKKPFLGICVGMQLLAEKGYEYGVHDGLGWIKGEVKPIRKTFPNLKIPHMGWNELDFKKEHTLHQGLNKNDHAYFVHSYQFETADKNDVVATVDYGGDITAIISRDNISGTQFHPEKSQGTGQQIIRNFLGL